MMKMIIGIAVAMMSINALFAELLVYEGFDYGVTNNAGNGSALTNGYGWADGSYWSRENSGDTLSISAGSAPYGNVVTTGNKFELLGSNGRYSNRSFANTVDSSVSDVIWGGIIMRTPSSTKAGRTTRFRLRNDTITQFYVYADSTSTIKVGGGSATQIDSGINPGTSTRLYLYKIDLSEVEPVAKLWISPSDFSSEIALGTPSVTITNIGGVYDDFSLGTSGSNPGRYDEVRIGTTLEDAWQTLPPVIPLGTVLIVQ